MNRKVPRLLLLAGSLLLVSCTPVVVKEQPPASEPQPLPKAASASLNIPPGHLPPPGECRIWYPEKPPGHQPPPGPCDQLAGQVPPGAWLITRPKDNHENVQVSVYDTNQVGVVVIILLFEAATGRFISEGSP